VDVRRSHVDARVAGHEPTWAERRGNGIRPGERRRRLVRWGERQRRQLCAFGVRRHVDLQRHDVAPADIGHESLRPRRCGDGRRPDNRRRRAVRRGCDRVWRPLPAVREVQRYVDVQPRYMVASDAVGESFGAIQRIDGLRPANEPAASVRRLTGNRRHAPTRNVDVPSRRQRLSLRRVRRRCVRVRRAVPRFHRQLASRPADRGHGGRSRNWRLLVRRVRR